MYYKTRSSSTLPALEVFLRHEGIFFIHEPISVAIQTPCGFLINHLILSKSTNQIEQSQIQKILTPLN